MAMEKFGSCVWICENFDCGEILVGHSFFCGGGALVVRIFFWVWKFWLCGFWSWKLMS